MFDFLSPVTINQCLLDVHELQKASNVILRKNAMLIVPHTPGCAAPVHQTHQ